MLRNTVKRLVFEDEGMEMVEWSIVGVVFALAGALIWSTMGSQVSAAVTKVGNCVVNTSGKCS